jgi:PAS domain S-box-containing protein
MIDEEARLEELRGYDILDSEREPAFDRLVEVAARICATPIALLSFVDATRQWCKAERGLTLGEISRELSFCAHAIAGCDTYVVEDATHDPRFAGNPLVTGVPGIRFYAGAPLLTADGHALGTLCVLDVQPRRLAADCAEALELVRDQVMELLERRRELIDLRCSEALREEAVEALLATKTDLEHRIEMRTREVQGAHRRTEHILARVADGFVALDPEWRYTYVNEQAARIFDRRVSDLVGKNIWSAFPSGVGQTFQLASERAMREQTPLTIVDRYEPWDRWFESRIYPSPEGLTIFFTEITEQKRAELALRQSEQRLAEAQAVAHVGSWEWSVATNRVVWSAEMFRIYGVRPEDFVGTYEGFLGRVYADDLAHTRAVVEGAYRDPKPFVYDHRIVRPDGSVRMLHTRGDVITDSIGAVVRMVGCCWDVTERYEATRALKETAAVLEATLAATPDAVLVIADDGRVLRFNERFAAMFAVPAALREGKSGAALLAHVEGVRAADGRNIECATRPFQVAGRVAGRVWVYRQI